MSMKAGRNEVILLCSKEFGNQPASLCLASIDRRSQNFRSSNPPTATQSEISHDPSHSNLICRRVLRCACESSSHYLERSAALLYPAVALSQTPSQSGPTHRARFLNARIQLWHV